MLRLILLTFCLLLIFCGFGSLLLVSGLKLVLAISSIIIGSLLLVYVEKRTVHHLEEDSIINDFLKGGDYDE